MPNQIIPEPDASGVVIVLTGTIQGREIHDLNEALMATPAFVNWRYQIWDFSGVDGVEVSVDDIREFAMQDAAAARLNPRQRIAIIPRHKAYSGLDKVFHVMEGIWGAYESKTFFDLDAARAWACESPS